MFAGQQRDYQYQIERLFLVTISFALNVHYQVMVPNHVSQHVGFVEKDTTSDCALRKC
jgi:hypothetical protein